MGEGGLFEYFLMHTPFTFVQHVSRDPVKNRGDGQKYGPITDFDFDFLGHHRYDGSSWW